MTESLCGAEATTNGTPITCDNRANHLPQPHFDSWAGVEWR